MVLAVEGSSFVPPTATWHPRRATWHFETPIELIVYIGTTWSVVLKLDLSDNVPQVNVGEESNAALPIRSSPRGVSLLRHSSVLAVHAVRAVAVEAASVPTLAEPSADVNSSISSGRRRGRLVDQGMQTCEPLGNVMSGDGDSVSAAIERSAAREPTGDDEEEPLECVVLVYVLCSMRDCAVDPKPVHLDPLTTAVRIRGAHD